jgi:hypothetical protein
MFHVEHAIGKARAQPSLLEAHDRKGRWGLARDASTPAPEPSRRRGARHGLDAGERYVGSRRPPAHPPNRQHPYGYLPPPSGHGPPGHAVCDLEGTEHRNAPGSHRTDHAQVPGIQQPEEGRSRPRADPVRGQHRRPPAGPRSTTGARRTSVGGPRARTVAARLEPPGPDEHATGTL